MKETIAQLIRDRTEAFERVHSIEKAIRALQDLCTHTWEDDGYDSHKSYKKCSTCHKEDEA